MAYVFTGQVTSIVQLITKVYTKVKPELRKKSTVYFSSMHYCRKTVKVKSSSKRMSEFNINKKLDRGSKVAIRSSPMPNAQCNDYVFLIDCNKDSSISSKSSSKRSMSKKILVSKNFKSPK